MKKKRKNAFIESQMSHTTFIEHWINERSAVSVVTFGPVVAGAGLAEPDVVHGPKVEIRAIGVLSSEVDVVLSTNHFVELGSNLVAALAPLDVQNILGGMWMGLREREMRVWISNVPTEREWYWEELRENGLSVSKIFSCVGGKSQKVSQVWTRENGVFWIVR